MHFYAFFLGGLYCSHILVTDSQTGLIIQRDQCLKKACRMRVMLTQPERKPSVTMTYDIVLAKPSPNSIVYPASPTRLGQLLKRHSIVNLQIIKKSAENHIRLKGHGIGNSHNNKEKESMGGGIMIAPDLKKHGFENEQVVSALVLMTVFFLFFFNSIARWIVSPEQREKTKLSNHSATCFILSLYYQNEQDLQRDFTLKSMRINRRVLQCNSQMTVALFYQRKKQIWRSVVKYWTSFL